LLNIAVLVSGGGTNLQAVIDAVESGEIADARLVLVVSSGADAYALTRAAAHGIPALVAGKAEFPDAADRCDAIASALRGAGADLIVLAGYMHILEPRFIRDFAGRIINIHPSLIPKYCGRGFYGKRVHRAVLAAGERESGATVHYVDEGVDTGPVILRERVPVCTDDDADGLAARVLAAEHRVLVRAVKQIADAYRAEEMKDGKA
jgi:phosphoribosylglycinamide formyltransferase-1